MGFIGRTRFQRAATSLVNPYFDPAVERGPLADIGLILGIRPAGAVAESIVPKVTEFLHQRNRSATAALAPTLWGTRRTELQTTAKRLLAAELNGSRDQRLR